MGEEGSQSPITRLEFNKISCYLTGEWMRLPVDKRVKIQVRDSRWQNGRGVFLCEDEETKRWVITNVDKARNSRGVRFRAFSRDELRSEQAMVKLSNAQVMAGYEKVLQAAIQGMQLGPATYMIQDKFKLKDGDLLCKLMLDLSLTEAIKARDGRISAGPTGYLCFWFKNLNLEDARANTEGSLTKAPNNTKVTTGNDPDTSRQAQAEVNEVQME